MSALSRSYRMGADSERGLIVAWLRVQETKAYERADAEADPARKEAEQIMAFGCGAAAFAIESEQHRGAESKG